MKCLVCKDVDLVEYEIEPGLIVHTCHKCEGNWLRMSDFHKWHNNQRSTEEEKKEEEQVNSIINNDVSQKLCLDCKTVLSAYKAASRLNFKIEHCDACGGIWFYKNEWRILRQNNLHTQIDKFFTYTWQRKIKEEEIKQYFDKSYIKNFGTEDYEKIKEIREWLDNNRNKEALLRFLIKDNPYKY